MVKNIMLMVVLGFVASILNGCVGMLPAESWTDYKKRVESQEAVPENRGGSKITHLPGETVRYNSGSTRWSPGVEVFEENNSRENRLVITPFFGGESPGFNKGSRDEKRRSRILEKQNERQKAIELAREDALNGTPNYEGVSGEYIGIYMEEFERTRNSFQKRDQRRYDQDEYRRGQDRFRQDHPEYGKTARVIDQIKEQAIRDAQEGYFNPPTDGRFRKDYRDAYDKEDKRLKREYQRRQHDRRR